MNEGRQGVTREPMGDEIDDFSKLVLSDVFACIEIVHRIDRQTREEAFKISSPFLSLSLFLAS